MLATGAASASVPQSNWVKVGWRKLLKELSSLPRAIAIMFAITGLSGLGTIIPQNKAYDYYIDNYPDGPNKVLGFLTYDWILTLQLDHIYSAWYFYGMIAILAASLAACTYTRQLPAVKVAQNWKFYQQPSSILKMPNAEVLPRAQLRDLAALLQQKDYQVFVKDAGLYAFKGLAGRLGPIGVHAALLLVLAGTAYSGFGGFKGSVMCPEGQDFRIGDFMTPTSVLSRLPSAARSTIHVNKFDIDYRPDGSVAQFNSDLSLMSELGEEKMRKTIRVNDPFRYGGVTMYQTDWSLASVTIRLLNPASGATSSAPDVLTLPMASLEGRPGVSGRIWASFLPLQAPSEDDQIPKGVSILARDLQTVVLYDSDGKFVGVRRPGSNKPIEVGGLQLVVEDVVGSTGLEIKNDPGVPLVYAGFGALMITTLISYLSHSQVWALQEGEDVYVAGKTNRAVLMFEKELGEVLDQVPEGS